MLLQNLSGLFDVHVTHGSGIKVTPIYKFEYEWSKTAIVSSITPAIVNVTGNSSLSNLFRSYSVFLKDSYTC
jgi:hypothetical protein